MYMTKNNKAQKNSSTSLYLVLIVVVIALIGVNKKDVLLTWLKPTTIETTQTYQVAQPRTYDTLITLPKPKTSGSMTVEAAIQERRSRREFSDQAVTMTQLSQLLWAAQGVTDPETGHRSAPSSRGAYPYTVYVVVRNVANLSPGLYEYLPAEHALGDLKIANAGELLTSAEVQPAAQNAPVVFVLAASYGKVQELLGDSTEPATLIEAGHIGQNMYLQTESLKMAMVVMAGFDPMKVGSALSLDPAETVIYIMPFGNRAAETAAVLGETTEVTHLFTAEELAQHDGKDGHNTYFAYEGKVYDVTGSDEWKEGGHYGVYAGKDLTGQMGEAPHLTEVFDNFPVVGQFGTAPEVATSEPVAQDYQDFYLYAGIGLIGLIAVILILKSNKSKK